MKLTDVFNNGQMKNNGTQTANSQSVSNNAQNTSVSRQIQALTPGRTLQGEVVARDGNSVQIKVADDFILEAKVDRNINLEVGKTMTFEVRGNGQTLQLSPLFANTATQANALKALEMASLPITQDTVAMTGLMMEAGLPIDRNSLQQMFREMNTFSNSGISDVVDLHKLGLPVNEENLTQVSSYKNLTHQLVDGMHAVQNGLSDTMGKMVLEGNAEGAAKLFQEVLQLVQEIADGGTEPGQSGLVKSGPEQDVMQNGAATQDVIQNGVTTQDVAQNNATGNETRVFVDGTVADQATQNSNDNGGQAPAVEVQAGIAVKSAAEQLQEALANAVKQMNGTAADEVLNLTSGLEAGKINPEATGPNQANSPQDTLAAQAKVLQELLTKGLQDGNKTLLETLVTHKGAQNILKEGLSKLWTITPEDVADSGKVEELYNRLNRQLKDLSHILEQNGQNQSTAFKAVSNMAQNIDFLQQINQAYTYVQLPLRLQNGEAHGDLYVYTNKRNLSAGDGQISALLHLDMEHLGPVDVYVAMQADNVNTRFYVQDDEMLDFLEQHMDILTQRLQKRGYNCDFAMQVRGEDSGESGLKGLHADKQVQPIARYAFDVRA